MTVARSMLTQTLLLKLAQIRLQHHRLLKLQKEESERLEKKHRQEISYMKFKDWLKKSLIK